MHAGIDTWQDAQEWRLRKQRKMKHCVNTDIEHGRGNMDTRGRQDDTRVCLDKVTKKDNPVFPIRVLQRKPGPECVGSVVTYDSCVSHETMHMCMALTTSAS